MTNDIGPASKSASSNAGQPITVPSSVLADPRRTLPPGYIHLGVAKEIAPTLREFGIDPDPVIREAGLDPRLFDDGTNVIPHAALGRLLTLCVARTHCPHFGLLVGQRATILSLGMVGRLMQHSETLGDAMRALVSNLSIQNRGAVPSLTISGDMALFTFSVYQPEAESADQISDGSLAVAVNAIRALCGADWSPTEVLLPRAAPADQEPYRRHFRAPVRFNQESAIVVFPARDLERRVAGADPMLRAMLEERISQLKGAQGSEFSDDIRRLLRTRLTSNHCSADDIAASARDAPAHPEPPPEGQRHGLSGDHERDPVRDCASVAAGHRKCRWRRSRRRWAIRRRAPSPAPSGAGRARRRPPGGATATRMMSSRL